MQTIPIPHVDPLPLPGPVWLFTALLLVVFTLHVVAMNSALEAASGRYGTTPWTARLASVLASAGPRAGKHAAGVSGFHGDAGSCRPAIRSSALRQLSLCQFHPDRRAMAGGDSLVMVAYYGFYYFSYTAEQGKGVSGCVLAISVCVLLGIAFIFVNNMTLMESPSAGWRCIALIRTDGI